MAESSLLFARLYRPALREHPVLRSRLHERLSAGLNVPFTLISAPPGFGKTSLLAQWAESLPALTAWLSVDPEDNDPRRLLTYLTAAIQHAGGEKIISPETSALLHTQPPLPVEVVATAFLNDLRSSEKPLVIIFDDYQFVESPDSHRLVTFLLEHLPAQVHLFLATRSDPLLPLARLRARGQMVEIRADDLRFTPLEAEAFFTQTAMLPLPTDQLAGVLAERTEGWAAGLQMAAAALQAQSRSGSDTQAFLREFSGSHRFVLDYLTEEVLLHLPADRVEFLLRTSILNRFCADLCAAVMQVPAGTLAGTPACQTVLENLDHDNLFLVPLDAERRWYRYHHLFADLLRARLKQSRPGFIPVLHRAAAGWLAQAGLVNEAIEHYLTAAALSDTSNSQADFAVVIHLMELHGLAVIMRGEIATFTHWLAALPKDLVDANLLLTIYRGAISVLQNDKEITTGLQQHAVRLIAEAQAQHGLTPEVQQAVNHLSGLRIVQADLSDRPQEIIPLAEQALSQIGDDPVNRVTILLSLGHAQFILGQVHQAMDTWAEAEQSVDAARNPYGLALTVGHQCRAAKVLGVLDNAAALYAHGLALLDNREDAVFMGLGLLEAGLGDLLVERGQLAEAARYAEAALAHPARLGGVNGLALVHNTAARLRLAQGDLAGANDHLDHIARFAAHPGFYPEHREQSEVLRAQIWLAVGDYASARQWADGILVQTPAAFRSELARMTAAQVWTAAGKSLEAAETLAQAARAAEAGGRIGRLVGIRALLADALAAGGEVDRALKALEQALLLGKPQGFVFSILSAGERIPALLAQGLKKKEWQAGAAAYARSLLVQISGDASQPPQSGAELIEPLSPREVEVLRLLADGLTNEEIATRLVLSTGTVRVHTANIYRKLEVQNRTQAAAKARLLNIL